MSTLNSAFNFNAIADLNYSAEKDHYTQQAFSNVGIDSNDWDASQGFQHNKPIIEAVYRYYTNTYNKAPDRFLWAGLGKMAGGVVLASLDMLSGIDDINTPIPELITIGKNIFLDLAWLHEVFLEDSSKAIILAKAHDDFLASQNRMSSGSYENALTLMNSSDPCDVATGNKALLQNEQHDIIEPVYQTLVSLDQTLINRTRAFVGSVHPYHRDFLADVQQGDVLVFDDRWKWITTVSQNMWDQWLKIPQEERTRLVNISMTDLVRRNFGSTIEGIFIGADDE